MDLFDKEIKNCNSPHCHFGIGRLIFCWDLINPTETPRLIVERDSHVTALATRKNASGSRELMDLTLSGNVRTTLDSTLITSFPWPSTGLMHASPEWARANQNSLAKDPTGKVVVIGWGSDGSVGLGIEGDEEFYLGTSKTPPHLLSNGNSALWTLQGKAFRGKLEDPILIAERSAPQITPITNRAGGQDPLLLHFNDFFTHPCGKVLENSLGQILLTWDPTFYGQNVVIGIFFREGRPHLFMVTYQGQGNSSVEGQFVGWETPLSRRPDENQLWKEIFRLDANFGTPADWKVYGTNAFDSPIGFPTFNPVSS